MGDLTLAEVEALDDGNPWALSDDLGLQFQSLSPRDQAAELHRHIATEGSRLARIEADLLITDLSPEGRCGLEMIKAALEGHLAKAREWLRGREVWPDP